MKDEHEFENVRKVTSLLDMLLGSAFGGAWFFFFLWVLVVFSAAIIYWAWPWLVAGFAWLREFLIIV